MSSIFVVDRKATSLDFLKEEILSWGDDYTVSLSAPEDLSEETNGLIFLSTNWKNWEKIAVELTSTQHSVVVISYDIRDTIKVIELQLFGFLLQPIDEQDLSALGKRWRSQKKNLKGVPQSAHIPVQITERKEEVYGIQLTDGIVFVKSEQIIRLEADNNYTIIYTKNGQKHVSSKSLKHFENHLEEDTFIRVHKSHIVNISEIDQYRKDKAYLLLSEGSRVEVSRRKKASLLERVKLI